MISPPPSSSSKALSPLLSPPLPLELLDYAFLFLSTPVSGQPRHVRSDLCSLALVNSLFHSVAVRRLYHTLPEISTAPPVLLLLRTLSSSPTLATHVRSFSLDASNLRPIRAFYALLNRVLRLTRRVVHLSLEFSPEDSRQALVPLVLDGLGTSPGAGGLALKTFFSSFRCDGALARFLESQPDIEELVLRGLPNTQPFSFLPSHSALSPFSITNLFPFPSTPHPSPYTSSAAASHLVRRRPRCGSSGPFTLSASALPRLSAFRSVHAGPALVEMVVKGRPVEAVSLSLGDERSLDMVLTSTRPIKRLTLMTIERVEPAELVRQVASRMQGLEALHVVALQARCDEDALRDMGAALRRFRVLRYLTFMGSSIGSDGAQSELSSEKEQKMAAEWHRSCPTLQTIILPRGKVWFHKEGSWECML